jgi:hypothetical protein
VTYSSENGWGRFCIGNGTICGIPVRLAVDIALPPRLRREFEVWSEISAAAEVRSMCQDYEDCTEALAR